MARWIDAELLAKSYLDVAKEEHLTGLIFISPEDVANTILRLSEEFENVAPVVHAHWIETEDLAGNHYIECSHCHWDFWLEGENAKQAELFHCPRCGAKMDEEVE